MPVNRRAINDFVEDLRSKAGLSNVVNMHELIHLTKELGGDVRFEDMPSDIDGKVEKNGEDFIITINNNVRNEERKKFTLAHELGHLFIHMRYLDREEWENASSYVDSVFHRDGRYSKEEFEANEFAGSLLMPMHEFIRKARDFTDENNRCNVAKLANYFGVSVEAALTRGRWLGIFEWD